MLKGGEGADAKRGIWACALGALNMRPRAAHTLQLTLSIELTSNSYLLEIFASQENAKISLVLWGKNEI